MKEALLPVVLITAFCACLSSPPPQLALKHRENKTLRQRILAFVGSPIPDSEGDLVKLGKKLKKNNIALDIVSFGETDDNEAKLAALMDNANSADNSCVSTDKVRAPFAPFLACSPACAPLFNRHLLTIPAGVQLLSDQIISSPILMDSDAAGPSGSGGAGGGGGGGGGGQFEFGVDPSMDPELAMALRMSLEEEQARQRASEGGPASTAPELASVSENAAQESAAASSSTAGAPANTTAAAPGLPGTGSLIQPGAEAITGEGPAAHNQGEEDMLQRALALSKGGAGAASDSRDEDVAMGEGAGPGPGPGPGASAGGDDEEDDEDMDEEDAIARAIEMSLKKESAGGGTK